MHRAHFSAMKISALRQRGNRDRPRFFDQVGDQTTNASNGNKHSFTKYLKTLSDLPKL